MRSTTAASSAFIYRPKSWKKRATASGKYFGDADGFPPGCPDRVKSGEEVCVTTDCSKCAGNPTRREHDNNADKEECFY